MKTPEEYGFHSMLGIGFDTMKRRQALGLPACTDTVWASFFENWIYETDQASIDRSMKKIAQVENPSKPPQFAGLSMGEHAFVIWSNHVATGKIKIFNTVVEQRVVGVTKQVCKHRVYNRTTHHVDCTLFASVPVVECKPRRNPRCQQKTILTSVSKEVPIPGAELPDPLDLVYGRPDWDLGLKLQAAAMRTECKTHLCLYSPYVLPWRSDGTFTWDDTSFIDLGLYDWADSWLRALKAHYPGFVEVIWQLGNCTAPSKWLSSSREALYHPAPHISDANRKEMAITLPLLTKRYGLKAGLQIEACTDRAFEPDGTNASFTYDFPPYVDCKALAMAEIVPGVDIHIWPDSAMQKPMITDSYDHCPKAK